MYYFGEMKYIIITLIIWNIITFAMMGIDKLKAIRGKKRISEATLIGTAFLLGGIGSLLGMVIFHHKTRKAKFLIMIPLSVVINIVAFVGIYTIFSPN